MRVTKKVIAAVLILCMMLQISGTAVIADDAANSRGTEIRDAAALEGGEPVHAADIVSVSVEGGKSVSPASSASASAGGESVSSASGASTSAGGESVSSAGGASASSASAASSAGGDTFSAGSEESHEQSQGEEKTPADEGLSAESSSDKSELNTDRAELSDQAKEAEAASDSGKTDDGIEALTGNGKAAGDEEAVGSEKAVKIEKAAGNKKAAKNEKAGGDEDADEDEKSSEDEKESGDEKESKGEKASEDEKESGDEEESRGNITAKDAGIVLEGAGEFDILVTGTLKSEGTPILIDKSVDPDNVSITVWKIEDPVQAGGKNEKHVVLEGKLGEAQAVTDDSKKVEAGIRYIIKIEPSQEKLINLEGTEKSHGYNTAKEGETVTLKISVPDGYKLVGAYNGDGDKVPLKKDDHGNYYVVVPKAGGVYLSAEFEESSDEDDDDECSDGGMDYICKYADRPRDREICDLASECNRIIYDLNGGTLNGDKGPIIIEAERDKEYNLLDAPAKPGARFLRWASSCKDVRVSKPGETFVFEHCVKFTAVWDDDSVGRCGRHKVCKDCDDDEDDEDEDDEDDGDEEDEDTDENDDGPDVTETVRITEANDEELNINSIKVDDNPAVGIEIIAARDVDVNEDITVTGGDQGATGIKASAEGKSVTSEVETGSGMKVKSEGSSVGIEASASDGGSLSLDFEGSIDVSSGSGSSVGISAHADSGSAVSIGVG
jgi:hypothetical protein